MFSDPTRIVTYPDGNVCRIVSIGFRVTAKAPVSRIRATSRQGCVSSRGTSSSACRSGRRITRFGRRSSETHACPSSSDRDRRHDEARRPDRLAARPLGLPPACTTPRSQRSVSTGPTFRFHATRAPRRCGLRPRRARVRRRQRHDTAQACGQSALRDRCAIGEHARRPRRPSRGLDDRCGNPLEVRLGAPRSSETAAAHARSCRHCLTRARISRRAEWPPTVDDCDLVVNATSERDDVLVVLRLRANARRSALSGDCNCAGGAARGRRRDRRPRCPRRTRSGLVRALDGRSGAGRRDASGRRLTRVTLELHTAGESHGPALVAIVSGLPAGPRARARSDRRRPPAASGGVRPKPEAEARAGSRSSCSQGSVTGGRSAHLLRSSSATAITRTGRGG